MEEPTDREPIRVAPVTLATLVVLLGGMIVLGVYPAPLLDAIQYASDAISGAAAIGQTVVVP